MDQGGNSVGDASKMFWLSWESFYWDADYLRKASWCSLNFRKRNNGFGCVELDTWFLQIRELFSSEIKELCSLVAEKQKRENCVTIDCCFLYFQLWFSHKRNIVFSCIWDKPWNRIGKFIFIIFRPRYSLIASSLAHFQRGSFYNVML